MRKVAAWLCFVSLLALCGVCHSSNSHTSNRSKPDCVPFTDASKHVGTSTCISGTVFHVEDAKDGFVFLRFCKQAQGCPFTVVVFPADARKVGDIRQLEGRQIEVTGMLKDYRGRTEIVLRRTQQLGESAFVVIPQVPTEYDAERQGHYSAGKFSMPKAKKSQKKQGKPISIEDPEEPE